MFFHRERRGTTASACSASNSCKQWFSRPCRAKIQTISPIRSPEITVRRQSAAAADVAREFLPRAPFASRATNPSSVAGTTGQAVGPIKIDRSGPACLQVKVVHPRDGRPQIGRIRLKAARRVKPFAVRCQRMFRRLYSLASKTGLRSPVVRS